MEVWRRDDGVEFKSEEEAYLDSLEYCGDSLADALCDTLNSDKLLSWAMKQEEFWEAFDDEITEARGMLFEDFYSHWDEPDDDDEIDDLITYIEQTSATRPKKQYAVDAWGDLYEVNPTD